MNIAAVLAEVAGRHPEHSAIIEGAKLTTYSGWWDGACRLAGAFADLGVEPGDRIGVLARNSTEFLETLFGAFTAGAVIVPINVRLHPKEVAYIVEHSGSKCVVYEDVLEDAVRGLSGRELTLICAGAGGSLPHALDYQSVLSSRQPSPMVERAADDLAWLFYTSGTTGRPKGAMVTHGNLAFMNHQYAAEVYAASRDDRVLHAGPLTHGSGLWAISLTQSGATHVIPASRSFNPTEVFELVERDRISKLVFLAPTMIRMLLDTPGSQHADCSSVKFIGYGGAPIHPDDLAEAMNRFGEVMCNIFGQGECPMTISMLSPAQHTEAAASHPQRLRSVGSPRGGIDVVVCDDAGTPLGQGEIGEICVRGPIVMKGYWQDEAATNDAFRSGWYHTGDLGRLDDDGYLYLLDRAKELIISGGANIYPREVENVLIQHEAIRDVAVFGIPDRLWGESVVAAVVVEPGATVEVEEIEALCRANLASYKKPRHVVYTDALPRSAYGKVLKRELSSAYASLASSDHDAG